MGSITPGRFLFSRFPLSEQKFPGSSTLLNSAFPSFASRNSLISHALDAPVNFPRALAHFVPPDLGLGPNRIGGDSMRFRTALCPATLFLTCFTVAAWSSPVPDQL